MLCAWQRHNKYHFIVFGLTRSVLEPTIYRTRDENANQCGIKMIQTLMIYVDIWNAVVPILKKKSNKFAVTFFKTSKFKDFTPPPKRKKLNITPQFRMDSSTVNYNNFFIILKIICNLFDPFLCIFKPTINTCVDQRKNRQNNFLF